MKLIIGIPTYNSRDALAKTLNSIVNDPFFKTGEVLVEVVDNCSDDGTRELVKLYSSKHLGNRIRYSCNGANLGRIGNWNRALLHMKVQENIPYGKLVFAGDLVELGAMKKQIDILFVKPTLVFVTGAHEVLKKNMERYTMSHFDKGVYLSGDEALSTSLEKGNWFAGCVAVPMFRISKLKDVNFDVNMEWAADWKFWVDLCKNGAVYFSPEKFATFDMRCRKGYSKFAGSKKAAYEESFMIDYLNNLLKNGVNQPRYI